MHRLPGLNACDSLSSILYSYTKFFIYVQKWWCRDGIVNVFMTTSKDTLLSTHAHASDAHTRTQSFGAINLHSVVVLRSISRS